MPNLDDYNPHELLTQLFDLHQAEIVTTDEMRAVLKKLGLIDAPESPITVCGEIYYVHSVVAQAFAQLEQDRPLSTSKEYPFALGQMVRHPNHGVCQIVGYWDEDGDSLPWHIKTKANRYDWADATDLEPIT